MTRALLLAATAALTLTAGQVSAQEWQGAYFGIAGGYGSVADEDGETVEFDTNLNGTFGDTVNTSGGANAFSTGFCGGSPNSNNAAAGCDEDDGEGEISLRAGYDWQSGPLVYGIVGEFTKANATDSVTAFSTTPAQYSFKRELDAFLAVRGRVGYSMGRFLPYATAGVVRAGVQNSFNTSNGLNSFTPRESNEDQTGFQVGGGVETRVAQNLVFGVEYLYTTVDDDDGLTVRTGPGTATSTNPFLIVNPAGTDMRRTEDSFDLHSFRFTASVRF